VKKLQGKSMAEPWVLMELTVQRVASQANLVLMRALPTLAPAIPTIPTVPGPPGDAPPDKPAPPITTDASPSWIVLMGIALMFTRPV